MRALLRRGAPVIVVLVVACVVFVGVGQRLPTLAITVGSSEDTRYLSGVLEPERDAEHGLAFRWTQPMTQLWLPSVAAPAVLALHIHSGTAQGSPPQIVTSVWPGHANATMALAPGWRVYHLLLSRPNTAPATLTLQTDPHVDATRDAETRGFPLAGIRFQPLTRDTFPWHVVPVIWLLALLAAGLWQLDQRVFRASAAWRAGRVAGIVAVALLGIAAWAVFAPYDLLWILPPMPWLLGLPTMLLLAVYARRVAARYTSRWWAGGAIGLLIAGQFLLAFQTALWLGGLLAVVGMLLLPRVPPEKPTLYAPLLQRRTALALLALIVLVAGGLRFYHLAELPYGLWRDEGRHGLVALEMLKNPSYRPAYVPSIELPGLGIRPFAWALWIWGIHPWSLRTMTALAGTLTVVPLYGLAAQLARNRQIALLAALLLGAAHWSISLSRFSFPTIYDPLLQLTGLCLLVTGLNLAHRVVWRGIALLCAGVCFGFAIQTYHTGRIGPVVAGVFALCWLLHTPRHWRAWLGGMLVLGLGFVLVAFPLLEYAVQHAAEFNKRTSSVFLWSAQSSDQSAPLAKLDASVAAHALMFFVRGDLNGRQIAPNRPMIDIISGIGLLAGFVQVLRARRDWRMQAVMLALCVGLLPSMLAVDYPHAMRSIDALGFACVIAAIGLTYLWQCFASILGAWKWPSAHANGLRYAVALATCALIVAINASIYFVIMPRDRQVWTAVYPFHTQVGGYVRTLADQHGPEALRHVFVPEQLEGNDVFDFLAADLPVQNYTPTALSTPAGPGDQFIVLGSTSRQNVTRLLAQYELGATPVYTGPLLPDGVTPAFVVYQKRAGGASP